MKHPKTILHIEVNNRGEYHVKYNAQMEPEPGQTLSRDTFEHDAQIMRVLLADDRVFRLFARIYEPVKRCRQREEKKKQKEIAAGNASVSPQIKDEEK